jgi:hypothetical protein
MRTGHVIAQWLLGSFLVGIAALPAAAQATAPATRPVTIDIAGGVNLATMPVPPVPSEFDDLGFDISTGFRAGFVGGVLVGVPTGDRLTFETGALLSVKGSSLEATLPGFGTMTGHFRMTYLDIPALAKFQAATTAQGPVSILAGVTAGFKLGARETLTFMGETISESISDGVSTVDLGLTIGARIQMGHALVDARYTHGLLNVASESGPTGETIKHRVFSFMGGWRF